MLRSTRRSWLIFAGVVCLFLLCAAPAFAIQIPVVLCSGWLFYLYRVAPQVTLYPGNIAIGLLALIASVILAHICAAWLWNALHPDRPWRVRWTLRGYLLVLCMFAAGVCFVAVTHQCYWVCTSRRPIIIDEMRRLRRGAKGMSVRSIAQSVRAQLMLYSLQHNGKYPTLAQMRDNWSVLIEKTDQLGNVTSTGELGPYLQSQPANLLTRSSEVVSMQSPVASAGWAYDQSTGELRGIVPQTIADEQDDDYLSDPDFLILSSDGPATKPSPEDR